MPELGPPEIHYLNAAHGWLGLGLVDEAEAELARLPASTRHHPAALIARWHLLAAKKQWEAALALAREMVATEPDSHHGWINQSFALHELRRTAEARDELMRVAARFGGELIVAYNLACYHCQLGDEPQARDWMRRAVEIGGRDEVKRMALHDEDLRPLWGWVGKW